MIKKCFLEQILEVLYRQNLNSRFFKVLKNTTFKDNQFFLWQILHFFLH